MNDKKIAVFDLDGTLFNTIFDLTDSVNYAMESLNLPTYSANQVSHMVGSGIVVTLKRALTEKHLNLLEQAISLQRNYYSKHCTDKTLPYRGITQMLANFKSSGVLTAVYTNKSQPFAQELCNKLLGNLIDFVIGTGADGTTKPNADRLTNLLANQNILPSNVIYAGDSDIDIFTAQNAKVKCISVTWGYQEKSYLQKSGATYFADTPDKLFSLATTLLNI